MATIGNNGFNKSRRCFLEQIIISTAAVVLPGSPTNTAEIPAVGQDPTVSDLRPVGAIRQRSEWTRFVILVWQYQNDVRQDTALYDQAGLRGFHIDRGAGEDEKVRFSLERRFPYYVDHAAGKGILYLNRDLQNKLSGTGALSVRPHSLADPKTVETLKSWLRENIVTTKRGLVYAYAFDDEISLGAFNNPVEVDTHPLSIAWYRRWLENRYGTIANLNAAWGTAHTSFARVEPSGFEAVRRLNASAPFSAWNLSSWMAWRHFMDYQFAQVLADLTRYTNTLDPTIPAGFVGAQQPSAYGGFDYALISRAVQWMEALDMGGINEILRSFWNRPRRVQVQTYDAGGSYKKNVWTLWNRLAHGHQAAIAWPKGWMRESSPGKRELSPMIAKLAPTFREIQGRVGEFIVHRDTYLDTDPIGLYYSHPSIRAGWVIDSIPHGATWPKRLTALDDANLSSAWLRLSWCKLLEDLGYQYEFVSYLDVHEQRINLRDRFKIIILNQTLCFSEHEAQALRRFVHAGGILIADALCGLLTETGRGRSKGALDDLFGLTRDETKGYFSGNGITEIDAEHYQRPFPERLRAYDEALRYRSMIVVERGTRAVSGSAYQTVRTANVLIRKKTGPGETVYLNLSPVAYAYFPFRAGMTGEAWRDVMREILARAGIRPRVEIQGSDGKEPWMESLLWRNGNRYCLAILKNIPEPADAADRVIDQEPKDITIRINLSPINIRNVRTGKHFGNSESFKDSFNPWEANLYEFAVRS